MLYVYILQSRKDGSFYTGSSENILKRLQQHNGGSVQSTKSKRPYKILWYCGFMHKNTALRFEQYLKTGSGTAFFKKRLVKKINDS